LPPHPTPPTPSHPRPSHPFRLLTDQSPELQETLNALLYKGGKFQFKRLEGLLQQAARSPARSSAPAAASPAAATPPAAQASLAAGGGSARSGQGSALTLVLSPEGSFVRRVLVEELSKGLDAAWRLAFDSAVDSAKQGLQDGRLLLQVPLLPGAAGAGGAAPAAPGVALLQSLVSLPQLAGDDDREQVDGILRLASAMYGVAGQQQQQQQQGGSGHGDGGSSAVAAVEQAAALLRWLASELQALPPAAQQQALLIPLEIAGKLTSRVTARLVKLVLAGGGASRGAAEPAQA
jgi:aarF domain-containing kinase